VGQWVTPRLESQIAELTAAYPGLAVTCRRDSETILAGVLAFEADPHELEPIAASFRVELAVPRAFPRQLPSAKETGGRIRADYEHLFTDGTMCLGVPIEQRRIVSEEPTLLGYVDRLLVPYLYGYCFWQRHGRHPFGEAAHGPEGILDHYLDVLGLDDPLAALAAVQLLYEHGYRVDHNCPCGSGRRIRACHHGSALRRLYEQHTRETLRYDMKAVFEACHARFERRQLSFPRQMRRQLRRLLG